MYKSKQCPPQKIVMFARQKTTLKVNQHGTNSKGKFVRSQSPCLSTARKARHTQLFRDVKPTLKWQTFGEHPKLWDLRTRFAVHQIN